LLRIRRPTGGGLGPAAAATLVLLAASPFFLLRSAVASYLLFAVLLYILHQPFGRPSPSANEGASEILLTGSRARTWRLPLTVGILFLLWANLDGGFVFGLVLLAAWTIGAVLQRTLSVGDFDDGVEASLSPGLLAITLAAAVVGSVINPYHIHAFRLPEELVPLMAPVELWRDPFFEQFFQQQFFVSLIDKDKAYVNQAGVVAAWAMYLLLAVGLASFAVNAGGWRWQRVLAWAVFAWLGASYARLAPYLAIVAGPVAVLNVQAFMARRRTAASVHRNRRVEHLRATVAAVGRVGLLLGIAVLLILAWPGWLGPDARESAPRRRVAWKAVPDPTWERLAKKLNDWYTAGELRDGEARGFHFPPSFSNYCAWFCPAEKGVFDARLTAPPEAIADYLALQRSVRALASQPGPEHPGPPDPLLKKAGITHLVLSGSGLLHDAPDVNGYALAMFVDPDRWPIWAVTGRGLICGWRDSYPKLRLDVVREAVGGAVEPLPPPPALEAVGPPATLWDRFAAAPAPTPPETYEAGLWLAYRAAVGARLDVAVRAVRIGNLLARHAPGGLPDLGGQAANIGMPEQVVLPLQLAWQLSPEGRASRAASLLAIRAARRAIRTNPADPEGFERLALAYGETDADPLVGAIQQITAARQALSRLATDARRATAPREEAVLQNLLFQLYGGRVIPGTQAPPLDLILSALERFVELRSQIGPLVADGTPEKFDANIKLLKAQLAGLQNRVRQNRDNWENRAGNKPPLERAKDAVQYGLASEALTVLRTADAKDLSAEAVLIMSNLALLAGEAETARDWLGQLAGNGLPELRPSLDPLVVQADAALGDYRPAIEHADDMIGLLESPLRTAAANVVLDLVFLDAPPHPLTRAVTMPLWGGLWRQGRPAVIRNTPLTGAVIPLLSFGGQRGDWLVLEGMLALESGDIPLARQRFTEALDLRFNFGSRDLAARWLEIIPKR
jgi:hypothetical protein